MSRYDVTAGVTVQAVILAGGLGTRMLPFTKTVPKPLLPVLGRPFLDYQIKLLRENGIDRFLLLVSHLGHKIEEYLGNGTGLGVTIEYSYEPSPLGTGGAIKLAERLLEDEFLVLNGDTLLDIDYGAFGAQFHRDGRLATIAAYRNQANHVSSNLALDEHDFVIAYDKNLPTGMYIDAGVVAVRKAGISLLSPGRRCSFEQEVFPRLIAQRQLKAWPTDELFFDMGTPDGMQRLESYLRARPCAAR